MTPVSDRPRLVSEVTVMTPAQQGTPATNRRPNILYVHIDNLGMGELGCYGGGILRGADTGRLGPFAGGGLPPLGFFGRGPADAQPLGADDRSPSHPLRAGSGAMARCAGRFGGLGADHRRHPLGGPVRDRRVWQVAYRR